MSDDVVTPADLARDLGLSDKTVRDWLRRRYGTLASRNESRWHLTEDQVESVRLIAAERAL
jgi:predicted site-specific integrase-resolvase